MSVEKFAEVLVQLPGRVEQRTILALQKSAMRLVVLVEHEIRTHVPYPIVDRGRLVQSVMLIPHEKGAIVRVDAPYASIMEWGARPFTPPLAPLAEWATRKGFADPVGVAKAIQQKFRKQGMKPKQFFARARATWLKTTNLPAEVVKALEPKAAP